MERTYIVDEWKDFVAENDISELAGIIETGAAEALMQAKNVIPRSFISECGLDRFSTKEELLANRDKLLEISAYFSDKSIYSSTGSDDDGLMFLEMHMSNIMLFGSVMLIDLVSTLHHITFGLPVKLRVFTDEYDEDYFELTEYLVRMFDDVVKFSISAECSVSEDDEVPFEDEWTTALDELVCEYAENASPDIYGDIVSMLLEAFCSHTKVMVPAEFDENSSLEMPYSYKCLMANDGSKFLILATRPSEKYDETLVISLTKVFSEFQHEELDGLVINPYEENIIIGRKLISAALTVFEAGVEYGKTLDTEGESEADSVKGHTAL